MKEKYLVINAGSSSLKFSLYNMPESKEIVNGYIEKIGKNDSSYTLKYGKHKDEKQVFIKDHNAAVKVMLTELLANKFISDIDEIKGIGHRILHGGEFYSDSVIIDDEVLNNIKNLSKLGPLHHPGEIAGILSMQKALPEVPQVAVFDTAFHQTMPIENYLYATPYEWYKENGVRKYGFHGTSHKYITETMQQKYGKDKVNLIICHIGSGASISCIKEGKCINTTMGLTPLDGLIMGTRSGSIDPSIIEYICKERNLTVEQVTEILNKQSGLLGIAGTNDLRDVESLAQKGETKAKLALLMMEKSIVKYIAEYYVELNGNVDALVFTAGVGEDSINVRENIVNIISKPLGVRLNKNANEHIARFKENTSGKISTDNSNFDILVEPTNEEYMILKDTYNLSKKQKHVYKKEL